MKAIIMLCLLSLVACADTWTTNNIKACAEGCKSSGSKMVSLSKEGCLCAAMSFPMLPIPVSMEDAGKE